MGLGKRIAGGVKAFGFASTIARSDNHGMSGGCGRGIGGRNGYWVYDRCNFKFCGHRQLEMWIHEKWKSVEWAIVLVRWQAAERVLEKEWVMCCYKVGDEVKLGIAAGGKRMVSLMLSWLGGC
ncbi:hypothetical protein Droror1_Dr00006362 [Drosera rotundifolia]